MSKLRKNYKILNFIKIFICSFFLFSSQINANEIKFQINGNEFTDTDVILSLLESIPENINQEYTNEIIKKLNDSKLFSDVKISIDQNKYIITVKEFPTINKIYYRNNERLKDEDLDIIASQLEIKNLNIISINSFINETKRLYESFGYNNIKIDYSSTIDESKNTADLFFNFEEGGLTKIKQISFRGNNVVSSDEIKQLISSKTKSIRNILANNNFKPGIVEADKIIISNYYRNIGYLDIDVKTQIEYLSDNKVNIFFNIDEGNIYSLLSIKFNDVKNLLSNEILALIEIEIENYLDNNKFFSFENIQNLKSKISNIILDNSLEFFEIIAFDKVQNNNVEIILELNPISPKYANQINILGNSRTFDYVIRRELEIAEGDPIYSAQLERIRKKLISLNLFQSVTLSEEKIDNNTVNLNIAVEEKQTGTVNAGVSVGTLDGFSIVTGLRERNFYGTGRSLEALLNTSEDRNEFKLVTTDRLSFENDANISYKIRYKQEDLSNASSYKLDTFTSGVGLNYKINENLSHNIDLEYVLKDYRITNSSTVANTILNSSGRNMSYLIKNNFFYSTLNSGFISKKGNYINFLNTIETPTSSANGFIRNILTYKKYYSTKKNIFSIQTKLGNIFSLNNNDILTDDKFALGGRWLRGFDNFGAGPRNSRTSYVGGNNLAVAKFDYSYEITNSSSFPIYINLFNDYGLIWENKTKPTQDDNSLRSSAGFGIKYYSPVGPIGFTWGFPIMDKEYDINRMFLFSVGNID